MTTTMKLRRLPLISRLIKRRQAQRQRRALEDDVLDSARLRAIGL